LNSDTFCICKRTKEEFLSTIEKFHGFTAPGLVLGGFMVDLAMSLIGDNVEADAIVETKHCLPDAVQLFTPCTVGNGWLKILDWDKFAVTLYDRGSLIGYRVWLDLEKTKTFPELYNWYMRLTPKKQLPLSVMLDVIFSAGDSVLSSRPVHIIDFYKREKKGGTVVCSRCREAYPINQGEICLACQGRAYYEFHS
jgi:formylmethanofuran dehydrogenase subunit E